MTSNDHIVFISTAFDLRKQIADGNHPPIVFITGHSDIPPSRAEDLAESTDRPIRWCSLHAASV
jgi:hypothetical protein